MSRYNGPVEILALSDSSVQDNFVLNDTVEIDVPNPNASELSRVAHECYDTAWTYSTREGAETSRRMRFYPTTYGMDVQEVREMLARLLTTWRDQHENGPIVSLTSVYWPESLIVWFDDVDSGERAGFMVYQFQHARDYNVLTGWNFDTVITIGELPHYILDTNDFLNELPYPEVEEEEEYENEYDDFSSRHRRSGAHIDVVRAPAVGLELEIICSAGPDELALMMEHEGLDVDGSMEYTHERTSWWKLVPDGSLPGNGIEVVSPVLTPDQVEDQVARVTKAMKKAKARVSTHCGHHIHHNANYLTCAQLANVALAYDGNQRVIDSMMPESRRQNSMCDHIGRRERESIESYRHSYGSEHASFLAGAMSDRYKVVNLDALNRHGTVEFRQHPATTVDKKIMAWYELTSALVANGQDREFPSTNEDFFDNKQAAAGDFLDALGLSEATKAYWLKRQAQFSALPYDEEASNY